MMDKEWRKFKLTDLFDLSTTKRTSSEEMDEEGKYPYISAQTDNNGVAGFCDTYTEEGGVITIESAASGHCFYQPDKFCAGGHVEKMIPKFPINTNIALFIITVLNKEKYRYSYGFKRNKNVLSKESIFLPADEEGNPDWVFMDSYINEINRNYQVQKKEGEEIPLQVESWKSFYVGDIFNLQNGKGVQKEETEDYPGTLDAVQGGIENNGVIGTLDEGYCKDKGYVYTDKPCLVLARSGSTGFISFHHDGCVAGGSAILMTLNDKKLEKNSLVYMFLRTILMREMFRYCYGRKAGGALYKETKIRLPVGEDGSPDWKFMEDYMKSLQFAERI